MSVSLYGSGGIILQVQSTVLKSQVSTTSNSYVATGLSVSITPFSTTSTILILATLSSAQANTNTDAAFEFARNGSAIGVGTASTNTNGSFVMALGPGGHVSNVAMNFIDSPATTSATTYSILWRSQSGGATSYLNGSNNLSAGSDTYQSGYISTITVMEISGS